MKLNLPNVVRLAGVVVLTALMMLAAALPTAAAGGQLPGQFVGDAFGNKANAKAGNTSTRLGRTAYQPCPCHGTGGKVRSSTVASVDGGDPYRSSKIVSTAEAEKLSGQRAYAQTTSHVANVSALSGMITAQSMTAVATVNADANSIDPSHAGSAITGLKINGQPTNVDPGQRINLPGFGYVSFYNVQNFGDGTNLAGVTVEMMRIVITRDNDLKLPIGSIITSAHAQAGYTRRDSATVVGAGAWGSSASSSSKNVTNAFGKSAPAYLGCFARSTSSGTARVNSTSQPGMFKIGQVVDHVTGKVTPQVAAATASSRLENVNLFGGMVTADAIEGAASATVDESGGQTSFDGSGFVNLKVLGQPVSNNVPPNTNINIPGLGTLSLFVTNSSQSANQAAATVNMIVLHVTQSNSQGIPVGSDITLAHARADAQP